MTNKTLSILTVLVCLSAGCSKRPKGILSEDKMVAVMTDLQIAEAYERSGDANSFLQGRNRELLGRGILIEHGVTPEEMDSTLAWYGRNMDEYPKLYKKIDAELNRHQLKYARAAGESENAGSSADIWPYSRHFVVSDESLTDGIIVRMPTTEIQPGDRLTWKMTTEGASSRTMTLGVDYIDGTTQIARQTNRGFDKWVEITLQTDSLLEATGIFAIADFELNAPRMIIDSIQLIHLPFDREQYGRHGIQRQIRPAGRKTVLPPDTSTNSRGVPPAMALKPSLSTE